MLPAESRIILMISRMFPICTTVHRDAAHHITTTAHIGSICSSSIINSRRSTVDRDLSGVWPNFKRVRCMARRRDDNTALRVGVADMLAIGLRSRVVRSFLN